MQIIGAPLFLLNAVLLTHIKSWYGEGESNYLYIFTLNSEQINSFFMNSLALSLISFTAFILNKNK